MRLKENFFDSNEVVLLESMQDGYLYSNILLKLYLRSLKDNGKLMFNDRIPYNSQMIATITRHHQGVVEKALDIFQQMGLIEVLDSGAIYMLDIQNYIGTSSSESDRIRKYRHEIAQEKQEMLQMYDKCTPKIEIEKEIEKELEIENKNAKETFASVIANFTSNEVLTEALKHYIEMRKKDKKFTVQALKLNLTDLSKLSDNEEEQIDIVNQTIAKSWKGFFPLKNKAPNTYTNKFVSVENGKVVEQKPSSWQATEQKYEKLSDEELSRLLEKCRKMERGINE